MCFLCVSLIHNEWHRDNATEPHKVNKKDKEPCINGNVILLDALNSLKDVLIENSNYITRSLLIDSIHSLSRKLNFTSCPFARSP